ncbi:Os11g0577932 [Oryza sativa Japonica Group]|uniref:Os11g0577932 protein n=1 Tax=Oryza sativa subsp. japonica TaxID=39947 RepID=A0A0P0Y3N7_ORYSJ|nr:Os11g0577932 [Oryza sativa Japonica Group]
MELTSPYLLLMGLLEKAKELVRMGLHPSVIVALCYLFMLIEILEDLVEKGSENMDVRNKEEVVLRIRSTVAIKKFRPGGYIVPSSS